MCRFLATRTEKELIERAAGANPVHVKEAVGHADLRMTMHYTHLSREHLRSLVDGGNILGTNRETKRSSPQSAAV